MIKFGLAFLLITLSFLTYSQSDSVQYNLKIYTDTLAPNNNLPFCEDSVLATPNVIVEGDDFDDDNEGIRISIANYKSDEDILVYNGNKDFQIIWNSNYGYLEIIGKGTTADYTEAVRSVYYKNIKAIPNLEDRHISVTLKDADYLPATQHFYKFIRKVEISWTEARDSAQKMSYNGLQGYLATITSAVENDFIWMKIDGIGWIGASDSEVEDEWKWVTGPEAGTLFWRGGVNGTAVGGRYSFWASDEPNDMGGNEDYAHVNQDPSKEQRSWNDLPNAGYGINLDYYRPKGFIVEFGGMPDEPDLQLSASNTIQIAKIAYSDERDFEICEGESIRLNDIELPVHPSQLQYKYSWTPENNINSSDSFNPIVQPGETTVYTVVGELLTCKSQAEFNVVVNPVPVSELDPENIICKGSTIVLNPGEHTSYLWETGESTQTISVTDEGPYKVKLTSDKGCITNDSVQVKYSIRPQLDYNNVETLVCGSKQQKLNLSFEVGEATILLNALQSNVNIIDESTLSPIISVDEFGVYSFRMEIVDEIGCAFTDTLNLEFHNQPTALFQIDEAECEGYNLKLNYAGETIEDAEFNWFSNDTLYYSGINVSEMEIPLGFGTFNRSVGLKINEQGCIDSLKLPVTVTPILNFWAEEPEGCTPLEVQFDYTATEQIDNFYWDFGDGINSLEDKPNNVYQNSGITDISFDVSLKIVSSEGCENSGVMNDLITVHPIPTIDFDFEENECNPVLSSVNYVGSGNENDTYLWDLTDFISDEIINNPGTLKGPLEFERKLQPTVEIGLQVVSEFGCKTDDTFSKTFQRKPIFEVTLDENEGCPPLAINFTAQTIDDVDLVEYLWDFGDGNNENGELVSNTFVDSDSKFDIKIIAYSNVTGCSDTLIMTEKVYAYPAPVADFSANPNIVLISYPVIQFDNQSTESTIYEWDFDDLSFSNQQDPEHRFSKMGLYDIQLVASNELGCVDTTMQQVSVAFDRVYPPNAFSPNASFEEDREFRIHSEGIAEEGYQLLIFNRWGEQIFESVSQNSGWDGKMKNSNFAPAGVYTWVIQYLDFRGEKFKQQGSVTLLF